MKKAARGVAPTPFLCRCHEALNIKDSWCIKTLSKFEGWRKKPTDISQFHHRALHVMHSAGWMYTIFLLRVTKLTIIIHKHSYSIALHHVLVDFEPSKIRRKKHLPLCKGHKHCSCSTLSRILVGSLTSRYTFIEKAKNILGKAYKEEKKSCRAAFNNPNQTIPGGITI